MCALKKTTRLEEFHRLLSCYKSESNDFLYRIVTGKDRRVYHNMELKSHSLVNSHPLLPEIKNARLNIPLENAFT